MKHICVQNGAICTGNEHMYLRAYSIDICNEEEINDSELWRVTKVNFCPFCGIKSQIELSKNKDLVNRDAVL